MMKCMRMMLVLLVAGALLANGCSTIKKKKPATGNVPTGAAVTQPQGPAAPPAGEQAPGTPITGLTPFPEGAVDTVYFDYDKSNLRKDQQAALDKDLNFFKSNPNVKVYIEGHCDERGTVEYNYALGMRRAQSVQNFLTQNGIAADRIQVASKGKEQPADPGHTEAAWAKNRRVVFMEWH